MISCIKFTCLSSTNNCLDGGIAETETAIG